VGGPGAALGKPYEPNGVVKNDVEFILRLLMKKIVDRGGDPAKPGDLLAEMERALAAKFKFGSVYGGDMQLHPDGTVSKPLGVYEVKGDQLVLIGRIVEGKIEAK